MFSAFQGALGKGWISSRLLLTAITGRNCASCNSRGSDAEAVDKVLDFVYTYTYDDDSAIDKSHNRSASFLLNVRVHNLADVRGFPALGRLSYDKCERHLGEKFDVTTLSAGLLECLHYSPLRSKLRLAVVLACARQISSVEACGALHAAHSYQEAVAWRLAKQFTELQHRSGNIGIRIGH